MHATPEDALAEAQRLMEMEAPEETPYVHLYEARNLLTTTCEKTIPPHQLLPLYSLLGQVSMAVEEPHVAQPQMERALLLVPTGEKLISFCNSADAMSIDTLTTKLPSLELPATNLDFDLASILDVLNQLGILWFNRTQYMRAFCYFKAAESLYERAKSPVLDTSYTHTLFYLAQLFGHMKESKKSAQYCQQTLRLQLETLPALPSDWIKNCLQLAEYYMTSESSPHKVHIFTNGTTY
jgi:hypothetical protein